MPEFVTIGAHGWDAERFFGALVAARRRHLLRSAARGAGCAAASTRSPTANACKRGWPSWASATYTGSIWRPAPPPAAQQHAADEATHTAKRSRAILSPAFIDVVSPRAPGRLRRRGIPGRPRLGCARGRPVLRGAGAGGLPPFTAGGTSDTRSRRESHPSDAVRQAATSDAVPSPRPVEE